MVDFGIIWNCVKIEVMIGNVCIVCIMVEGEFDVLMWFFVLLLFLICLVVFVDVFVVMLELIVLSKELWCCGFCFVGLIMMYVFM